MSSFQPQEILERIRKQSQDANDILTNTNVLRKDESIVIDEQSQFGNISSNDLESEDVLHDKLSRNFKIFNGSQKSNYAYSGTNTELINKELEKQLKRYREENSYFQRENKNLKSENQLLQEHIISQRNKYESIIADLRSKHSDPIFYIYMTLIMF